MTIESVCRVIGTEECEPRAKELAEYFGVDFLTMLNTLDALVESGLIFARHWRGVPGPFWDLTDAGRRMIGR